MVHNPLEQSSNKFINNKAQAIRCKSGNLRFSDGLCGDLSASQNFSKMHNPKNEIPKAQPGLWPTGETANGLEKSILYVNPDRSFTHDQVKRFVDYLEMAIPTKAIAALVKMYFDYSTTPGVPKLFDAEELDEFAHLVKLFADLAMIEGEHLTNERELILEGLYYSAKFGGDDHGEE